MNDDPFIAIYPKPNIACRNCERGGMTHLRSREYVDACTNTNCDGKRAINPLPALDLLHEIRAQ